MQSHLCASSAAREPGMSASTVAPVRFSATRLSRPTASSRAKERTVEDDHLSRASRPMCHSRPHTQLYSWRPRLTQPSSPRFRTAQRQQQQQRQQQSATERKARRKKTPKPGKFDHVAPRVFEGMDFELTAIYSAALAYRRRSMRAQQPEYTRRPLHGAAFLGLANVARRLLERGTDVNQPDKRGNTAVHWAAKGGRRRCLEVLLEHNANVNFLNRSGFSPLRLAVEAKKDACVSLLCARGASTNSRHSDGRSPLHQAVRQKSADIVRMLLAAGAKPNVRDKVDRQGWTALHYAAFGYSQEICRILLNAGADMSIQSRTGQTALDVARNARHAALVTFLEREQKFIAITPFLVAVHEGVYGRPRRIVANDDEGDGAKEKENQATDMNSDARGITEPLHCKEQSAVVDLTERVFVDGSDGREGAVTRLAQDTLFDKNMIGEIFQFLSARPRRNKSKRRAAPAKKHRVANPTGRWR